MCTRFSGAPLIKVQSVGAVPKKARKKVVLILGAETLYPTTRKEQSSIIRGSAHIWGWARTPCMPGNKGTILNVPK
jgi:hypothetical protein